MPDACRHAGQSLVVRAIEAPSPVLRMVICVLAIIWVAKSLTSSSMRFASSIRIEMFLKKNDDPNWEVSVGGMPLGKPWPQPGGITAVGFCDFRTQRWMVLSAITAIVLLCVVGQARFARMRFAAPCVFYKERLKCKVCITSCIAGLPVRCRR